ncbi:hypothetical protein [Pseudonocardia broussonetiae]|uniref:Uncharacterized protein n=1 Tax=Pseudonocardia broussonetiae TaxID=2736640 RepID=A0A6M6JCC2_9PSEU|nr:hypothetical protein [Pseudonocardia broussonetiae]QJY45584.1 hypothetical protein HOP40_07035 [Pseudonocardia broussonetiae]
MADEVPIVLVEIAHIHAASRNGPRWRSDMTDDERRAFENLILLCVYHHKLVDNKPTGNNFKVATLRAWKNRREQGLAPLLQGLTEVDLKELLAENLQEVIGETRRELLGAIRVVEGIAAESASMLRVLVEQTLNRPYLDAELVGSLAESARAFGVLPDYAPGLSDSARSLRLMPDYVPMLKDSARPLNNLPDYVAILQSATREVARIPEHSTQLLHAVTQLREAADSNSSLLRDVREFVGVMESLSSLERSVQSLLIASKSAADNAVLLDEVSAAASTIRVPDRLTYFRNGAIAGMLVTIVLVAIIWYQVAGSVSP